MALYVKFDCATCENKNCTGHGLKTTEKVCDGYKHTQTNADKLRAMSDEELAEFILFYNDQYDFEGWLDWLREEAHDA